MQERHESLGLADWLRFWTVPVGLFCLLQAWVWIASPMMGIGVAFGVFAAVLAVRTVEHLRIIRWNRRFRSGLCVWCGYDLRASGGYCPECGAATGRESPEQLRRWFHLAMWQREPPQGAAHAQPDTRPGPSSPPPPAKPAPADPRPCDSPRSA